MGKHKSSGSTNFILKELFDKVKKLEENVEKLQDKSMEYNVNIEKLDIQKLENLTFHLDSLDIDELSGSLNLGNNFGVKTSGDSEESDCIFRSKKKGNDKDKK